MNKAEKFKHGQELYKAKVPYTQISDPVVLNGWTEEEKMSRCRLRYNPFLFKDGKSTGSEIFNGLKSRGINLGN